MSRSLLPEAVEHYVTQDITREPAVQKKLRAETARLRQAGMQIGADEGALLALLVRAIGAKNAVEIGTFTGYSALAVAAALPAGGRLVCCDINEEWTAIARRYWKEAGVADPKVHDPDTDALRALNAKIRDDARVDACLLTVGDGVMLALKR